jgi:hypothetical protein
MAAGASAELFQAVRERLEELAAKIRVLPCFSAPCAITSGKISLLDFGDSK